MTLVIDASVALTWCFEDEQRPETDAIGRRILGEGVWAPAHFCVEIANVVLVAERRRRITPAEAEAEARLARLALMPISLDAAVPDLWERLMPLAREERLTVYDSAYLELALRLGAEIATLDTALAAAARRHGLTVLPRD